MSLQERYQPGTTLVHRLDARVKVVVGLTLIVGIVLTPDRAFPAYPLLWALLGSLAEIGQIGAIRISRTAVVALPFALTAMTLLFTTPGQPVTTVGTWTITDAGLVRFAAIVLKSWLAIQAALILTMTTPFTDLLWALSRFRLPPTLLMIFAFTYRYLFMLVDEAERLMRARSARSGAAAGHKPGGSLIWRARVAGGMVATLFIRSYERSERVYLAMRARGYSGESRALHPAPLTHRAFIIGAIPLLVLLIIELLAVIWSR